MYDLPPALQQPGTHLMDIVSHRIARGSYRGTSGEEYLKERMTRDQKAFEKIQELRDGRIIAVSSRPIAGGGWVRTHEDITERRQIEARIAEQKAINEMQRSFISMASHEFRTPLAIIDSSAQKLKARASVMTPEDIISRADTVRSATKRIVALMESVLAVAKHDDGHFKIAPSHCDVRKVVLDCIERQREAGAPHEISADLAALPDGIIADDSALDLVFTNLLSNAVKYSPPTSPVEIRGRVVGRDVVLEFVDHGIGMDEADVSKLFTRFFRAKTAVGTAGTGIGLYVVKLLTEQHGGSASVASVKGQGTTFTVRLPLDGPDAMTASVGDRTEISADGATASRAA
jgi:signal transduction histidine kinase